MVYKYGERAKAHLVPTPGVLSPFLDLQAMMYPRHISTATIEQG